MNPFVIVSYDIASILLIAAGNLITLETCFFLILKSMKLKIKNKR